MFPKMSKETIWTKNTIQPCIISLLSPSAERIVPSAVASESIEATFQSVKQKKQKRSRKSGDHLDNNNPNKKSLTKTPKKMADSESN